jgi:cellulose synthase/poly-beta-1,6-N-acetylglucosamine synthase-like glycosyltransferase
METVFWLSVGLVLYVYAGYPLLLAVWSRAAERPVRRRTGGDRRWPTVSVVVAARNEAARLPRRVDNLLGLTYPARLDIIIVSDGSTDATAEALAPFGDRVRLIACPPGGKPLALNAGVAAATGEVLVFADARQRFDDEALRNLVGNFDDPDVGAATGELILDCEDGSGSASTIGDGVGLYWKYEKWLRRQESRVWSTLGATGAIYAMRRELWRPLPAATLLDDVLAPMQAVLAGRRIVFDERARAFDTASPDPAAESRRKTRTLAGNYQILRLEPRLLLPILNPVWVQYASHKIGRLLVPWALLLALLASVVLARGHWMYMAALAAQLAFYGLAMFGGWLEAHEQLKTHARRAARVAYTFVMMNYAAVAGLFALRRGREVWR